MKFYLMEIQYAYLVSSLIKLFTYFEYIPKIHAKNHTEEREQEKDAVL